MTFAEMVQKWGQSVAEDIRDHKLSDPTLKETEVRRNPMLPHREAGTTLMTCMFVCILCYLS